MEELDLEVVLQTDSEAEALMVRGELDQRGIECFVSGMEGSALGASLDGADVISIQVASTRAAEAKKVIALLNEESGPEIPAWTCSCGERVDAGFFLCWSCEKDYETAMKTGGSVRDEEPVDEEE